MTLKKMVWDTNDISNVVNRSQSKLCPCVWLVTRTFDFYAIIKRNLKVFLVVRC